MFGRKTIISVVLIGALAYYLSRPKQIREGKLIETKSGAVRGIISVSRDGREFYEWLGIPYAKPPVGELRFASPQPIGKWEGVRDGSQQGSQCVQNGLHFSGFVTSSEDCLFLNVYSPKKLLDDKKQALPVLVYIHGGAYILGSSSTYQPGILMDEEVVVVSIQYRVDILGFLSTGDKAIRGNMGLKDQVQALKWVKENINSFGGDPNKITIFGHSAGGASVHQLLLSPMTKGLFHKAISHSGAASNTWGFKSPEKSLATTKRVAKTLGCPIDDTEQIATCLRNANVNDLMNTVQLDLHESPLFNPHKFGDPAVPTIEGVDDEEAFLAQHPLEVIAQGKAHRVPWMVGHTADEGLLSLVRLEADDNAMLEFEQNMEECIKSVFSIDSSKNMSANEKAQEIYNFYLPPAERSTLTPEKKLEAYGSLFGDAFFNFDIRESIFYQRQFSPVYPYFFNKTDGPGMGAMLKLMFSGKFTTVLESIFYMVKGIVLQSYFGMEPPKDDAVHHAQDMVYIFPLDPLIQMPNSSKIYEFSKSYVKLLVDFAKNESSQKKFRGVEFSATPKTGPLKFLEITNDVPKVISEPFRERMKFLHDLKIRDISR